MNYQLSNIRDKLACIVKTDGNMKYFIPLDEANTDYQAFLLWKSEGNEPLPADE
jgi:hypothetical protein